MNFFNTGLVIVAAFLAVFWESAFQGIRHLFGVQPDLLPPLMVYAALKTSLNGVCVLALVAGLLFDSMSANPLGSTVLPLLVAGLLVYGKRDLILKDQAFAQGILGMAASAAVPVFTLVLLLSTGRHPLLGWGTVWQLSFLTVTGGLATPVLFILFGWAESALRHTHAVETSFRSDREIRRGR